MKRIFKDKEAINLAKIIKEMEERVGRKLNDEEIYDVIKTLNHMAIYHNAGEVIDIE